MDVVDLGERVADAGADGLACSLGLITEPPGAATEAGGGGERMNQRGALGAEFFGPAGIAGVLGVGNLAGQGAEPGLEVRLSGVVENRVGAGRREFVPDQG